MQGEKAARQKTIADLLVSLLFLLSSGLYQN